MGSYQSATVVIKHVSSWRGGLLSTFGMKGSAVSRSSSANHASISSGTFRLSFQVGASDTLALRARLATSLTDGSSGLSDFAFRASGRRLAAWRACPKCSSR